MKEHGIEEWLEEQDDAGRCPRCRKKLYWFARDCPNCRAEIRWTCPE